MKAYSLTRLSDREGSSTSHTHSYILKGEDRPRCVGCDEDITVKHILLDCVDFSDQRPRFYSSPNIKHLFTQVPGHQIISFLKQLVFMESFKLIIIFIKLVIHIYNLVIRIALLSYA